MRTRNAALFVFASLVVGACSTGGGTNAPIEQVGQTSLPILNGTLDTKHTAVIAVLIIDPADPASFDECSGEIVKVANGIGTVLTAAHCCGGEPTHSDFQPSIVVLASDYSTYVPDLGNSNPDAPAYAVVPGSYRWDPAYNGKDHDFCMLEFSGATAGLPTLKLPTSADDGLTMGVNAEFVGFGATVGNGSATNGNSQRYTFTGPVDQMVTSDIIQYGEMSGGVCNGDSGGPALLPAGAAQSQQTIVATASYVSTTACNGFAVSSRVSSEIGPGGFITEYLAGNLDAGSESDGATDPCQSCEDGAFSVGGQCAGALQACESDSACNALITCLQSCTTSACDNACVTQNANGITDYNAIFTCLCTTACTNQCASLCIVPDSGANVTPDASSTKDSGSHHDSSTMPATTDDAGLATDNDSGTGMPVSNATGGTHSSGCAIAAGKSSTPGSNASFAGILVGAALLITRRRKAA